MGELESLLLVLALIYLSECLVWVPRGALAFSSWRGIRFGIRFSGSWIGNQHGGLLLSNPLPPLGTVFIVPDLPLSVAPAAVFAYSSACLDPAGRQWHTGRHLAFEIVRNVDVDGRKVLVNGEIFLKAASPFSARWLAASQPSPSVPPRSDNCSTTAWIRRSSPPDGATSKRESGRYASCPIASLFICSWRSRR